MIRNIIHPDTKVDLVKSDEGFFYFQDNSILPIINGTPILFFKDSVFSIDDIYNFKSTTQNGEHLNTRNIRNFIRRKLLPSLTNDSKMNQRYNDLGKMLPINATILILGAGEKTIYYKTVFKNSTVITSDVHNTFKPDLIFDGHSIPFKDGTFDLVLAAQVIEHVINPWLFCNEIQRVTKIGGLMQIEAPQNFPYHAAPYDFYRFTFTGLRSLFPKSKVVNVSITEGNASMVAVTISNFLINSTSLRYLRSFWLLITYITLGWLKYLDRFNKSVNLRSVSSPKGFAFTFEKDDVERHSRDLLCEFYELKK